MKNFVKICNYKNWKLVLTLTAPSCVDIINKPLLPVERLPANFLICCENHSYRKESHKWNSHNVLVYLLILKNVGWMRASHLYKLFSFDESLVPKNDKGATPSGCVINCPPGFKSWSNIVSLQGTCKTFFYQY